MYNIGSIVTCIYLGVFSWSDGSEFTKTIPLQCKVLDKDKVENFEGGLDEYRLHVDCTKSVDSMSKKADGIGLVKGHPINLKKYWTDGEQCYMIDLTNGDKND